MILAHAIIIFNPKNINDIFVLHMNTTGPIRDLISMIEHADTCIVTMDLTH